MMMGSQLLFERNETKKGGEKFKISRVTMSCFFVLLYIFIL